MKLYACDRCDRLIREDETHFVEIDTDSTLGTTTSTKDKILAIDLCEECYNGLVSFLKSQKHGSWRKEF